MLFNLMIQRILEHLTNNWDVSDLGRSGGRPLNPGSLQQTNLNTIGKWSRFLQVLDNDPDLEISDAEFLDAKWKTKLLTLIGAGHFDEGIADV